MASHPVLCLEPVCPEPHIASRGNVWYPVIMVSPRLQMGQQPPYKAEEAPKLLSAPADTDMLDYNIVTLLSRISLRNLLGVM